MDHLYIVIMSGGEGARFYPYSTPDRPKQFLNFFGNKSLIRQTYDRILSLVSRDKIYVSTSSRYAHMVKEHLPEIFSDNIISEPTKKNTGPALVYATHIIHKKDPDAVICCLPSDHFIEDENGFKTAILSASSIAEDGYLVVFGVKPTWPSTDYGYICPVSQSTKWSPVRKFAEKPKKEVAEQYIKAGYMWNCGIFIWQASIFVSEIMKHAPELEFKKDKEYFDSVPSISIDYALMEKSQNVVVMPVDIGWSDVGAWESVDRLIDSGANVSKELVGLMKGDERCPWRKIVPKPWGHEELWAHTDKYVGKILFIKKGSKLSLQYHKVKEETLRLLSGEMDMELGDGKKHEMDVGDVFHVPPGTLHRMIAKLDCLVMEVSTPEVEDIVRVEDDYGRQLI